MTPPRPPIRDRRIRFALVGCGRIAKSHFAALENCRDRAELVAVCDAEPAALGEAARRNGAKAYESDESPSESHDDEDHLAPRVEATRRSR